MLAGFFHNIQQQKLEEYREEMAPFAHFITIGYWAGPKSALPVANICYLLLSIDKQPESSYL
jgi:hypothetical protein